jgi:lipid-binding SYLF domain-containing protein
MIGTMNILRRLLFVLLVFGLLAFQPTAAQAENDAKELLVKSEITLGNLITNPDYHTLQALLKDAKGVLIFPSLLKAGFFFGAEGGSGLLLSRNSDGTWGYPAFFTLGAVSFGLQFGGQDSETVFVIMTGRGVDSIIGQKVKLGVDVSVAVGPVGIGASAATTVHLADVYSFSRARGAYAGASFEGAVIYERKDLNEEFYGSRVTATEIVKKKYSSSEADKLRALLMGK